MGLKFNKNVLRLEVSVNDSTSVQVANACEKLLHNYYHVIFGNCVILEVVENLPAVNLFHHNEHPSLGLVHFSDLNNIGRTQQTDNLDFVP